MCVDLMQRYAAHYGIDWGLLNDLYPEAEFVRMRTLSRIPRPLDISIMRKLHRLGHAAAALDTAISEFTTLAIQIDKDHDRYRCECVPIRYRST